MACPRWHAVTLRPDHLQGEGEGELGVGRGAGVRLWGRMGGEVSGCSETLAVRVCVLIRCQKSIFQIDDFQLCFTT